MKIFVETDRLLLREILQSDVEAMFELNSDPEVHKYLGSAPIIKREEVYAIINFVRQQYVEHGIGRWAIIDKKTNAFIGWAGLKFITELTNHHQNYYDLGYRILRQYWGQGIATEAAVATVKYAFEQLKLEQLFAIADCQNEHSNTILKKVGLQTHEQFDLNGVPHNWYSITKQDYQKKYASKFPSH